MKPEQFERLPKYIKDEILRLRNQVETLQEEVKWRKNEDRVKTDASNTVVVQGIEHHTALLPFSEIEYWLKDPDKKHWKPTIRVMVSRNEESIQIMGSDAILVVPDAANVVRVTLRD